MNTMTSTASHDLAAGSLWASADVDALRAIRCTRGTLWLTQAGNPGDVLLHAGDQYVPRGTGKIVIQALSRAAFTCRELPCAAHRQPSLAERRPA